MGKSIYGEMTINWGIVFAENSQLVPIRNGPVVTWHHVNLQVGYNVSDEYLEVAFISEGRELKTKHREQKVEFGPPWCDLIWFRPHSSKLIVLMWCNLRSIGLGQGSGTRRPPIGRDYGAARRRNSKKRTRNAGGGKR